MKRPDPSSRLLLPLLGAVCVMLAAWLLPLPGFALSEDQLAPEHTPQVRAEVEAAREQFTRAQERYASYIKSHDVGLARAQAEEAARQASSAGANGSDLTALRSALLPVSQYAGELQRYAAAGEAYFEKLRAYDDNLMGWTRSLGSALERLRNETWPFVEYLKRYPPPVGEKPDPPMVTASQVLSQTASLDSHITGLGSDPGTGAVDSTQQAIRFITAD
ncbi:MAG TPA: hypothetical protein VM409_01485, partial [Chloroflexia bacterium]|nr:hypothetical protein [Chloroflexia bacterium]